MDFFDSELYEVENKADGVRYVLRRNPVREAEMATNCQERVKKIQRDVEEKNSCFADSLKRDKDVAQRSLQKKISQYKLNDVLELTHQESVFTVTVNEEILKGAALLDGCYVIKTDVKKEILSTEQVHDRYKDLAKVEHAFRAFKQSHLDIRPVHVRTQASTRGQVFAVMLAYKIERLLSELWKKCECSVPEGIDGLAAIRSTTVTLKESSCQKIPQSKGLAGEFLAAAGITLPSIIDAKNVAVVTRKKLALKFKYFL